MNNGGLLISALFLFVIAFFKIIKRVLFQKRLDKEDEDLIYRKFKYYRNLKERKQRQFSRRVREFIKKKNFEGRKNLEVTNEMKLQISATAIMLTFGYEKDYLMSGLETFIIYPEEFYSNNTKTYNKGETNMEGIVVFSWKDFTEGFKDERDNINLGFHELAHAFILESKYKEPFKEFFDENYEHLGKMMVDGDIVEKARELNFFREYAYTNKMEFIACAVETFFESPENFKKELPELYHVIAGMLNQDNNKKIIEEVDII
ncbi:MAG: zinc-dependent peptidase [Bacteroidales bacterium]|nr:zinc-dependent peptidase [Bacteroidales bacterium]